MSTSNIASPQDGVPFAANDTDAAFDFMSFMGFEPTSTSPFASGEAGPSKATDDGEGRAGSSRGRTKARGSRAAGHGDRSSSSARDGMEIDTNGASNANGNGNAGGVMPFGPSQMLGMGKSPLQQNQGGLDFGLGGSIGQDFDASQAQMLQQQLEHIHMQSPLVFDPNNTQSPFHPMAQMFLASPMNNMPQLPASSFDASASGMNGAEEQMDPKELQRRIAIMNGYGMFTPAPSGEMFPQSRMEDMSPMQLEMLARGEHDLNMTPLLSPAISSYQSTNQSPANFTAFTPQSLPNPNKSPLEQLQEQQKQFQEQLAILQQQQRDLQATAAAVAASQASNNSNTPGTSASIHTSPYITAQPQSRSVSTPGLTGPHSAGSINTPSPQFFSPLTSPALEGHRSGQFAQHPFTRPPHPLSALSSPALNPVGSSGGAQQTLSPALGPQSNADMADPDYLRSLMGMSDGAGAQQHDQMSHGQYHPAAAHTTQHHSSPLVGPLHGTGPHRQSLPSKTRPSPMIKPVNHRAHGKHASTSATPGHFSLPTSPAIQRVVAQATPGIGYLPPAAIQPHSSGSTSGTGTSQSAFSTSTPSTPSPVDLNQLMPPPPVPVGSNAKGVVPMTPASLMNLGNGIDRSTNATPVAQPKRQNSKATPATTPAPTKSQPKRAVAAQSGKKMQSASRLAPTAAGKRALAMRPPGAVGVRAGECGTQEVKTELTAATKGAAAAAALVVPEGENRKTSHKAAEQKRRDSLKAGFDELRLLLPPINTEALDPESGEPIPGSSAPRLLPKSSLVPDDNPNRGVSKVALLKFSNEYIVRLHDKVEKRDDYIERLRMEVQRLREGSGEEMRGPEDEDLLEMDMLEGEEDDLADPEASEDMEEEYVDEEDEGEDGMDMGVEDEDDDAEWTNGAGASRRKGGRVSAGTNGGTGAVRRPSLGKRASSGTVKAGR